MSSIGERVSAAYSKHPPAASTWWGDAEAFDSGGAFLVDSNLTHLSYESPRLLGETVGPPAIAAFQNTEDTWWDLEDVHPPAGAASSWGGVSYDHIPWDRRTALCFGPVHLIADYDLATGVATARRVRCRLTASIDASMTSYDALFALTLSDSPAALAAGAYLAFDTAGFGGTGARTATVDLAPTYALPSGLGTEYGPTTPATGATGPNAIVVLGYVWFGWLFTGSTNTNTILSACAWELR